METGNLEKSKYKHIAQTAVSTDTVALYMLAQKYKKNFLSLLALYEVYGKDVFLFFYIMSAPAEECFIGKNVEDLHLEEFKDFPKDSNLKLIFSRAKKISTALRKGTGKELNTTNLAMYQELESLCKVTADKSVVLDFFTKIKDTEICKESWTVKDEEAQIEKLKKERLRV